MPVLNKERSILLPLSQGLRRDAKQETEIDNCLRKIRICLKENMDKKTGETPIP